MFEYKFNNETKIQKIFRFYIMMAIIILWKKYLN